MSLEMFDILYFWVNRTVEFIRQVTIKSILMKNLIFIFLLLPISIFGQTEISVDSVSLIEYNGGRTKKQLGYQTISNDGILKKVNREKSNIEQSLKAELSEDYPNYDKNRDMPLPVRTNTILDSKGRFHPSAKWETYRTFPSDSVAFLLDILNCKISMIKSIDTVSQTLNELGDTVLVTEISYRTPSVSAMCFIPRLGIFIWSKGEIVDFYSVCFECSNVAKGTNDGYMREYQRCIYIDDLKMEVERLYGL